MKVLKYILFLLLILTIGISIYVVVQPNSFEVTRERTINAPASVIYNHLIDFKNWEPWSPWLEKKPDTKLMYSEKTTGVGGSYSWEDDEGIGKMKTLSTTPNISIEQDIQFDDYEPSRVNWTFAPTAEGGTKVTWQMKGDSLPFMFKAYSAFSGGFDKMIGPDFERGLEKLDSVVIDDMKKYSITIQGATQHSGGFYLYNTTSCKINELEPKMKEMLPKVLNYASSNSITVAGPPFVNYLKWDPENNAVIFLCCVPTTSKVITTNGDILTGQLEPFRAVKAILKGNYSNLQEAWEKTMAYLPEHGLEANENGPNLEAYVTDPLNYPNPADWITEIFVAIKE
ncbi:MAG TPA: SRPBCC family protein [Flavobacteriaceae bacterium]